MGWQELAEGQEYTNLILILEYNTVVSYFGSSMFVNTLWDDKRVDLIITAANQGLTDTWIHTHIQHAHNTFWCNSITVPITIGTAHK